MRLGERKVLEGAGTGRLLRGLDCPGPARRPRLERVTVTLLGCTSEAGNSRYARQALVVLKPAGKGALGNPREFSLTNTKGHIDGGPAGRPHPGVGHVHISVDIHMHT